MDQQCLKQFFQEEGHQLLWKEKIDELPGFFILWLCVCVCVSPTRWPRVLPILEPEYVARKIIQAVLTDQTYLLMPRTMYIITALKK